jgi:hypothetical protein
MITVPKVLSKDLVALFKTFGTLGDTYARYSV